ncbi:NAD(P)-dependent oxidoreductase [Flavobacterium subsaxonicum]|nr:NAD(P)-dependent oxidoreductase [Flavobacterium subsaxonicum]
MSMSAIQQKIGWIGLGNMGKPMVLNLIKAGFDVTVYNRSSSKTQYFKDNNIPVSPDVKSLVETSDIIFTIVTNDAAVQAIYDEVLLVESLVGKLFIDMSTISKDVSVKTAQALEQKGAGLIDAPVAGSTTPAAEGTLIIMAGGKREHVERAKPYLEKLGKSVKYLGDNGAGLSAKLSVNYFISILYQGLAETILFAEANGISRENMLEIINESASGSGATKVKTPLLVQEKYSPTFALNLMLKDILLAKDSGANFPFTSVLVDTYGAASQEGFGENDVIGIIEYLKK